MAPVARRRAVPKAAPRGTEPAFSGEYWDNHQDGVYRCGGCGAQLFTSGTKFNSSTGPPSFFEPAAGDAVKTSRDWKMLIPRTEVHCRRCGGHLGHPSMTAPARLAGVTASTRAHSPSMLNQSDVVGRPLSQVVSDAITTRSSTIARRPLTSEQCWLHNHTCKSPESRSEELRLAPAEEPTVPKARPDVLTGRPSMCLLENDGGVTGSP